MLLCSSVFIVCPLYYSDFPLLFLSAYQWFAGKKNSYYHPTFCPLDSRSANCMHDNTNASFHYPPISSCSRKKIDMKKYQLGGRLKAASPQSFSFLYDSSHISQRVFPNGFRDWAIFLEVLHFHRNFLCVIFPLFRCANLRTISLIDFLGHAIINFYVDLGRRSVQTLLFFIVKHMTDLTHSTNRRSAFICGSFDLW